MNDQWNTHNNMKCVCLWVERHNKNAMVNQ